MTLTDSEFKKWVKENDCQNVGCACIKPWHDALVQSHSRIETLEEALIKISKMQYPGNDLIQVTAIWSVAVIIAKEALASSGTEEGDS